MIECKLATGSMFVYLSVCLSWFSENESRVTAYHTHTDAVAAVLQQLRLWLQLQHLSLSAAAITGPVGHIRISVCVFWFIFFTYSLGAPV